MHRDVSEAMRLLEDMTEDEKMEVLRFLRLLETDPEAAHREYERVTGKRWEDSPA